MVLPKKAFRVFSIAIFPATLIGFVAIYVWDVYRYLNLLREDNWVEWLTFACLMFAGILSWDIAIQIRQREQYYHWFYIAFGFFCVFAALEEISWGERVFSLQPPDFFLGRSDQQEINIHNVLQQQLDFKTKDVAALVLAGYGLVMPLMALNARCAAFLKHLKLVVPPLFLMVGFFLATLLMLDIPTGWEEELGEFFFALCFLLFMIWELDRQSPASQIRPFRVSTLLDSVSAGVLDRITISSLVLLAFALRFWRLDRMGLWLGEAVQAMAAQANAIEITHHAWTSPGIEPPALPLLLHVWIPIIGSSETGLRFLPALAGVLSVPLVWQLLKMIEPTNWKLRAMAALLLALAPGLLYFAQDLSPYSILVTLALLSLYAAVRFAKRPTLLWSLVFIIVNWIMLSFHLYAVTLLVAEAVFFAIYAASGSGAGRRRLWVFGSATLLSLLPFFLWVLLAPEFSPALAQLRLPSTSEEWSTAEHFGRIWRDVVFGSVLWQPYQARRAYSLILLALLGVLALFPGRSPRPRADQRIANTAWAVLVLGALLIPLLPAAFVLPGLPSGALIVAVPAILILVSMGILYLWQVVRLLGLAGFGWVLLIAVVGIVMYYGGYQKSAYEDMAAYVRENAQTNDGILLETHQQHLLARYYLGDIGVLRPIPAVDLPQYWLAPITPVIPEEVDDEILMLLHEHPSLWLILHDEKSVDPYNFVRQYLTAVSHRQECSEWLDLELCRFASPHFRRPSVRQQINALFGEELLLQDIAVAVTDPDPAGEVTLLLTLNWLATSQPSADYKVSVRLVDALDNVIAQLDSLPIGPLLPPTVWQEDDQKPGYLALKIPGQVTHGTYSIEAVVYDPATASPLAVTVDGDRRTNEPVTLALVEISDDIKVLATE